MSSKRCFRCLRTLPLESFYPHKQMKDGHLNKCKECAKRDEKLYRQKRLEHYRQYDKARASSPSRVMARAAYRKTAAGKLAVAKAHANYKIRFPNRRKAQHIVGNAIRDGKLAKNPCFVCGNEKTEAHHPDYDRPLDVVWLCNKHHRETHEMIFEERMAA